VLIVMAEVAHDDGSNVFPSTAPTPRRQQRGETR
jgi:hypothetical protein